MPAERNELVITREFAAPRSLVWQAWTKREHLEKWWGPKGMTLSVARLELSPGGTFLYKMSSPQGDMWGKFVYREITPETRLVYVSSFSNEKGEITRPPFPQIADSWPPEVENTLTLEDSGESTLLTLRGKPLSDTDAEWETWQGMIPSMKQGFGGTFDQLDDFLANVKG
ncbi:MAG: SRPBCC domain-containing protein [Planctomycetes bacterium]|nr:SRPBCC domain-containing protein [Planctomycetota bacterium]